MRQSKWFVGSLSLAVLMALVSVGGAEEVVTVEDGCGKVLSRVGNTIAIHLDGENKAHVFKGIDDRVKFHVNGVEVNVYNLDPGDRVCVAEVKHIQTVVVEHHEVEQTVQKAAAAAPAAPKKAAPAPAPKKAAPAPASLPHTASAVPAAGLAGVLLIVLSAGIAVLRRV